MKSKLNRTHRGHCKAQLAVHRVNAIITSLKIDFNTLMIAGCSFVEVFNFVVRTINQNIGIATDWIMAAKTYSILFFFNKSMVG